VIAAGEGFEPPLPFYRPTVSKPGNILPASLTGQKYESGHNIE
jgi:hypothetical protein